MQASWTNLRKVEASYPQRIRVRRFELGSSVYRLI